MIDPNRLAGLQIAREIMTDSENLDDRIRTLLSGVAFSFTIAHKISDSTLDQRREYLNNLQEYFQGEIDSAWEFLSKEWPRMEKMSEELRGIMQNNSPPS